MDEHREDVADGGKEITEQSSSWKSKLSAAFNDQQIFFSLSVLVIFYVVYTIGRANFDVDGSSRNEDERFIQSCYCSFSQRFFFRFWFSFCCLLWFLIHSYTFSAQVFIKKCPKLDECFKKALTCCIVCPSFCYKYIYSYACKKQEEPANPNIDYPLQIPAKKEEIEGNFRKLWFQYCELYVVGYAKDDDKEVKFPSAQKKKEKDNQLHEQQSNGYFKSRKHEDSINLTNGHICSSNQNIINDTNSQGHDFFCFTKRISIHSSPITNIKHIIRVMLLSLKYISQLITVPLLLLQMFDTYSLLCFSPDPYCSHTTEYQLHLAQAAMTLLFYASLASSHLASTILAWNPWPDKDDKQFITYI